MSDSILTLLVNTILERFRAAGFQVPENMTQKESEEFVLMAIENAEIVPADRYESLIAEARSVIENWERAMVWRKLFASSMRFSEKSHRLPKQADPTVEAKPGHSKVSAPPATGFLAGSA